jgi:alcohol dehydrogenase class IV
MQYAHEFRAVGYPFRLYSGKNALDKLPDEVARHRASRAFIICGRTVSRKTPLIRQISALLGDKLAGLFDEIDKDTTLSSVRLATDAARAAQADLIIGVGAGSVIQGARVVTILLAEKRPLEDLITKYPEHGPAISARLMAPKLPIINVLTAPTTAQNRAGSRVKDDATGRGMEFFDPKTRPGAIFWDADALLTAPASLIRTGAATAYCRCVMNLGGLAVNPLVEGNRLQAFRLAAGALPRIGDTVDPAPRLELCAATLLQNREADDGGTQFERHWAGRVIYAFSTALFSVFPHVGQGEGTSAVTGTVLRRLGARDPEAMLRMARALNIWEEGIPVDEAPFRVADALDAALHSLGMSTRLSALGVNRAELPRVIEHSLRNFNADPKREFIQERELLSRVLDAAW